MSLVDEWFQANRDWAAQMRATTVVKPAHDLVVTKRVRDFSAHRHHCKVVVVKKHRGHRVVVTKVRRCW